MATTDYQSGDWVIYRKQKSSPAPGPRAKNMNPASKGETYTYDVDKYWIVDSVSEDGNLLLRTRTGKQHRVGINDSRLRKPRWYERMLLSTRFRAVEDSRQRLTA